MEVVDFHDNELVVQATLTCRIEAKFVVEFHHWNGIDKEYMPMGSAGVDTEEETELEVLLTIVFDNGQVILDHVDLAKHSVRIDGNELEPDWMTDREEED